MKNIGFMNQYDDMRVPVDNPSVHSFSLERYTDMECYDFQTPTRLIEEQNEMNLPSYDHKASTISARCQTPNTFTISFGELNPIDDIPPFDDSHGAGKVKTLARPPVEVQDHALAERKRRQKFNQHFMSLRALLPNLKRMDKASVLEEAANYIRELQDRVKELERLLSNTERNDAKECIIALKRLGIRGDDDNDLSSNETNTTDCHADVTYESSAEIQVRVSGNSVLVRIISQRNSSLLVKVVRTLENLGLSVINSSVMLFANTTTLVNVVAQIEGDLSITPANLVKSLELAIRIHE